MTDDSDPPPLPADDEALAQHPAAAPALPRDDAATVLARGHLHPAVLLLRLLGALRQTAFPLFLGIAFEPWFLAAALGLFLLQLGAAVVRYLTLEYTLTLEELRIREGLLHRQERRIPLDRIQDLAFESTLLRRALGLTVVLVETASGRGVEARLDALSRNDAEHLREVLLGARPAAPDAAPSAGDDAATIEAPSAEPRGLEWLVHQSSAGALLIRGATDLRLGAFVVTGYAAFELAEQLGFVTQLAGVASSFRDWLASLPPIVVLGVLAALLFAVMAFGVITSTLGNLVQFHGFNLRLRGDVLQRRFGLLTTRQKTLPRARIQRVTIEQTWLRRLLGYAVVKADSAGGSRSDGQDTTGGWDVVVPLARTNDAHALLPAMLPGVERETFSWRRGSPKLIARTTAQGVLLAAAAVPALWWRAGPAALWALLAAPLAAVLGVLIWRNLAWARGADFFALQHGVIGRNFACVPTAKVQAVVVRQGLVSQALGLADLTVYVAGGSPTRIPDLTLADARALQRDLAARAAAAAAADW